MIWQATPLSDSSDGLYVEVAKSHARRNCLVIGPAGSGKLSLVRGLAALTNSQTRKFLFDWQIESNAQAGLMDDLLHRWEACPGNEIWIFRQMEKLPIKSCQKLLHILSTHNGSRTSQTIIYGTSEDSGWLVELAESLDKVFGIQITLGHGKFSSGSLNSVFDFAGQSLRERYGGSSPVLEPEAKGVLEILAADRGLSETLDNLERLYVRMGCTTVTAKILQREVASTIDK